MKFKLIVLLSLFALACGNDDSTNQDNTELLVGQWNLTQRIINNTQSTLGACEPFSVYTYSEDGTYSELHYAAEINTTCIENQSILFNGTWERNSNGQYRFTNSNSETSEVLIEFDTNNSFVKTFSSISNPNDPVIQTVQERYERE